MSSNDGIDVGHTTNRPHFRGRPLTDQERQDVLDIVDEVTGSKRPTSMIDRAIRKAQTRHDDPGDAA